MSMRQQKLDSHVTKLYDSSGNIAAAEAFHALEKNSMPSPRKGETQSDFVRRCIPMVLGEKTTDDPTQAAAICYSMYDRAKKKKRYNILHHCKRRESGDILSADKVVSSFISTIPEPARDLMGLGQGVVSIELKHAAKRLTLASDGEIVLNNALYEQARSMGHGAVLEKSIAVFENVLSSSREDRDGDVLHVSGMTIDKNLPFLWMHMMTQPIGSLLYITERNEKIIKAVFALANTQLAEDCAKLMEVGAIRTSIGFLPESGQAKPRKTTMVGGKKKVVSWEVLKSNVIEDSAVSVPSNEDAIITQFSRKSLKSDVCTAWAKTLFDARPATAPGMDLIQDESDQPDPKNDDASDTCAISEISKSENSLQTTENAESRIASMRDSLSVKYIGSCCDTLPGSYERIQHLVRMAVYNLNLKMSEHSTVIMQAINVPERWQNVNLIATFDRDVLIRVDCGHKKQKYLRGSYTINDVQDEASLGEMEEVSLAVTINSTSSTSEDEYDDVDQDVGDDESSSKSIQVASSSAIELARHIAAKMVSGGDPTVRDALDMMAHAVDLFNAYDEDTIFGSK